MRSDEDLRLDRRSSHSKNASFVAVAASDFFARVADHDGESRSGPWTWWHSSEVTHLFRTRVASANRERGLGQLTRSLSRCQIRRQLFSTINSSQPRECLTGA